MAPKAKAAAPSNKQAVQADKTFGLKNKNKSKAVQKYIKQVTQTAGDSRVNQQKELKAKTDAADKVTKTALMASLFNLQADKKGKVYDPVAKKAAAEREAEALAAGAKVKEAIKKQIIEGIANTIRLTNPKTGIRMSELGGHPIVHALKDQHADTFKVIQLLLFIKANDKVFWCDDMDSNNPMIRCQADVDQETAPDDRTLEEIIEERRKNITGAGTPVNAETFKAWKQMKEAERMEKVEEDRKALAKKTGGQGLAAMSGRDLFSYDASLFVDDDGAASEGAYDEREEYMLSEDEDDDKDDDDEPDREAKPVSAARGSAEAPSAAAAVAINKDIFLQEDDDEDLDDLDDDDE